MFTNERMLEIMHALHRHCHWALPLALPCHGHEGQKVWRKRKIAAWYETESAPKELNNRPNSD